MTTPARSPYAAEDLTHLRDSGITLPAGTQVVFFGAVRTDHPGHGEPLVVTATAGSVKVSALRKFPAKGRATGGVRAHRLRSGESGLAAAWVGPRPVAATGKGDPLELPQVDPRRDGSGEVRDNPDVIGSLIERG